MFKDFKVKINKNMTPYELDVLAEQTSQAYSAITSSAIASIVNSFLIVFIFWSITEHSILLSWLALVLLISIVRLIFALRYKKLSSTSSDGTVWSRRFLMGSVSISLAWSISALWFFPTNDITHQVFLAFVLGGMSAGAITSMSYFKSAVYSFLLLVLIPVAFRLFFNETTLGVVMGAMIILYLVILLQLAKQSHMRIIQNITMRIDNVNQKRSLEESEHRYKTLLDTATDAFFLHDLDGKFIDVNNQACSSLGYTRDELLSMSVSDIESNISSGDIDNIWDELHENENFRIIGNHKRKDGSSFPVEISLGSIHFDNQSFISVLARDITERQRIDKMKNEFISTVSHELRTPLTSIRGSLGLITGGATGDVPVKMQELLTVANNNTERLLFLINDILDIQKIESDNFAMEFEVMEISPFLEQSVKDNMAYADQYGVKFILKSMNNNIKIDANKERLMQVMANLLSNSAKFSHHNGVVEISVSEPKENTVRISVTDYGAGISKEFYPKIFERFTQQDSSDTRNKGGTGLGLNITKSIIEKHGGEIGFTSVEGEGTTFYFDLPQKTN